MISSVVRKRNVNVLVENFGIGGISNVDDDINNMIK